MQKYEVDSKLVELRQNFREYYNDGLKRKYAELEPARKKYLKKFCFWAFIFSFFAIVYICFCIAGGVPKDCYASKEFVKLYFIYIAIACGVCSIPISDYKEKTKLAVMDRILDFWGEFNYSNTGALISKDYIKKSALFDEFDEQEQDDAFRGQYHGAEIKVSEQKLEKVIYTSKGRRDKTIFNGVLIALHLNKKYKANTVVCGKNSWKTFLGYNWFELIVLLIGLFFGVWLFKEMDIEITNIWSLLFLAALLFYVAVLFFCIKSIVVSGKHGKGQQIFLEDIVFSKKWRVFADDQVEARYVLTPALMERMLMVKKLFHGNRLDFSFWGNNLLIAVHTTKDMFETTSLFKDALDYRKVQEVICQMYSVFSVIDVLKLQNKDRKI